MRKRANLVAEVGQAPTVSRGSRGRNRSGISRGERGARGVALDDAHLLHRIANVVSRGSHGIQLAALRELSALCERKRKAYMADE